MNNITFVTNTVSSEIESKEKLSRWYIGIDIRLLLLLLLSRFSRVRLCATPQTAAHQASRPWDSPGKNTGVGCHCLLQCVKVKSLQSCPTLKDPMDCSLPGSSVHGIFQARVLERGAIAFYLASNSVTFGKLPKFSVLAAANVRHYE